MAFCIDCIKKMTCRGKDDRIKKIYVQDHPGLKPTALKTCNYLDDKGLDREALAYMRNIQRDVFYISGSRITKDTKQEKKAQPLLKRLF